MIPKRSLFLVPGNQGKRPCLKCCLNHPEKKILWLNGDDTEVRNRFKDPSSVKIRNYLGDAELIIIDEAQRLQDIGLCLKIITDNFPGVKVYASGSASFDLVNKINEPLTGRKWEYILFPLSFSEMAGYQGLDNKTVEKYIQLLEKAFIVFRLNSFSRNLRNELAKSRKIYFYDNGLRNAVISQFNPIGLRNDEGKLWENFLVSERYKHIEYNRMFCNRYFWRTTQQKEIDYIEERDGILYAWEFKWGDDRGARIPVTFLKAYPDHRFETVNRKNFLSFISNYPAEL